MTAVNLPKVIHNESVVMVDVDDTLILHLSPSELLGKKKVEVYDPITKGFIVVAVHGPMVRLVQEESHRGSFVVVWSRGGYEWASNVVKALGLEESVDQIMSKPIAYFDDKPIDEWLKYRVYLKPDTIYKNIKKQE